MKATWNISVSYFLFVKNNLWSFIPESRSLHRVQNVCLQSEFFRYLTVWKPRRHPPKDRLRLQRSSLEMMSSSSFSKWGINCGRSRLAWTQLVSSLQKPLNKLWIDRIFCICCVYQQPSNSSQLVEWRLEEAFTKARKRMFHSYSWWEEQTYNMKKMNNQNYIDQVTPFHYAQRKIFQFHSTELPLKLNNGPSTMI